MADKYGLTLLLLLWDEHVSFRWGNVRHDPKLMGFFNLVRLLAAINLETKERTTKMGQSSKNGLRAVFFYHGLCLKGKPWSSGHPVSTLTD